MDLVTRESPGPSGGIIATTNDEVPRTWAERYLAAHGDDVDANSDLVQEVVKDAIDHQIFKHEIQRLVRSINTVNGFCGKCRHLLQHWPDVSAGQWTLAQGRVFSGVCEIKAATIAGCKFCTFLHSRLVHSRLLDTFQKIETRLRAFGHDGFTSFTIQNWGEGSLQSHIMWLNLPGKKATWCNSRGGSVLEFESDVTKPLRVPWRHEVNSDIYELARMWLCECEDFHGSCLNKKEYERSSRLLSFNRDIVRVVRTEIFDVMPKYATLSYCWGSEPFMSLTKSTMGSFVEGVRMSDLPQTFRDAIHVAKELGLSYIWIDALCIIQDDPEDWTIESSRMRSVYGNSYVNLAASSATNVHEGFFSRPEDYKYYSGGFCAPVSTTECSTIREFHSGSVYKENSESTHLATRAWTLQERLLPARTISFGVTGIFWECRSGIRSEFFPCGIPGPFVPHQVCPEDQAWYWDDIIAQYSAADLTNPEDKLPALAGIARRQQEATGHQYLAGMWKESLVTGIIWVVEGRRKRPAWRAPSWSWMAVDSQIFDSGKNFRLNTDGVKQYISVLDAWTTPSGPDRFGKVSDGLLSLACTALVRAHLLGYDEAEKDQKAKQTEEHQLVRLDGVNSSLPISMDVLEEESSCSNVYLLPVCGGPSGNARIQKRLKNNGDHEKNIRSDGNEEHNESDLEEERVEELVMYGLVLRACGQNTGDSGRFSRVGSFSLGNMNRDPFSEEPDRNYYGEFMEVLDRRGHQTVGGKSPSGPERTDSIRRHLDITIE